MVVALGETGLRQQGEGRVIFGGTGFGTVVFGLFCGHRAGEWIYCIAKALASQMGSLVS